MSFVKIRSPSNSFAFFTTAGTIASRVLAAETSVHKILLHIHNDQNLLCHSSSSFLRIRICLRSRIPQTTCPVKRFSDQRKNAPEFPPRRCIFFSLSCTARIPLIADLRDSSLYLRLRNPSRRHPQTVHFSYGGCMWTASGSGPRTPGRSPCRQSECPLSQVHQLIVFLLRDIPVVAVIPESILIFIRAPASPPPQKTSISPRFSVDVKRTIGCSFQ